MPECCFKFKGSCMANQTDEMTVRSDGTMLRILRQFI